MPTGYTAAVADGTVTDFRTFALLCARNFGACVSQRDEPPDVLPRPEEPSDYHRIAGDKAVIELKRLNAMTLDEAKDAQDAARIARAERDASRRQMERAIESRYRAMLWRAERWKPPTPEHEGLATFMRQQLNESLRFDLGFAPAKDTDEDSPQVWLDKSRAKVAQDIGYHKAEHARDVERTNQRNAWLAALVSSLTQQEGR